MTFDLLTWNGMQAARVNKKLWAVERHAMQIYTGKVYEMCSKEMDKTHNYGVPQTRDKSGTQMMNMCSII